MKSRKTTFLLLAVIFSLLFIFVANITSGSLGVRLDEVFANWADQQTNTLINQLMSFASIIGSSEVILLVTVLIGLYFLIKRYWHHFFFFFVLSVGGVILNLTLKLLVKRARPDDEVSFIEVFDYTFELQSYSFPSGHTMRATILFLFIIYLAISGLKRTVFKTIAIIGSIVLLLLVALSRIMLDAHYATDIIGAIVISLAWFFLCLNFFYPTKARLQN
ncbi:MAG TPA: phosphatase PAP2 family protein [Pseudogracilibacillus sp.]|nr:phosphatase PAP2 family protein [Pseudogracilibacillus sp.]